MLNGKRILAVVPARSGSKGIKDKNLKKLNGISLIGWAGLIISRLPFVDKALISTDSAKYAEEGSRFGLESPFLRPPEISKDSSGAVETVVHALLESEKYYDMTFDIILIVEPTSPLRRPGDVQRCVERIIEEKADSVVAVSPLSLKAHPRKLLVIKNELLSYYISDGGSIVGRQMLDSGLFWRNGVCYALTRSCLVGKGQIFSECTLAEIIDRPIVNIDEPIELDIAELLMSRDVEIMSIGNSFLNAQ